MAASGASCAEVGATPASRIRHIRQSQRVHHGQGADNNAVVQRDGCRAHSAFVCPGDDRSGAGAHVAASDVVPFLLRQRRRRLPRSPCPASGGRVKSPPRPRSKIAAAGTMGTTPPGHGEAPAVFLAPALGAVGGGQPVGAAAGEDHGVHGGHQRGGVQGVGLVGAPGLRRGRPRNRPCPAAAGPPSRRSASRRRSSARGPPGSPAHQ